METTSTSRFGAAIHTAQPPPIAVSAPVPIRAASRWGFPEFFVISQTVLPALLFLPGTQPIRVPIRVAAYGMSLIALAIWAAKNRLQLVKHPSRIWLIWAIAYLVLMIGHPTTNSFASGLAQSMLYLSVLAPVFWAPGMVRNSAHLRRLLTILLICNGVNSVVGILQVYDPVHWMPKELTSLSGYSDLDAFSYKGADGKQIVRPPGLSDIPGGVCGPAMTTGLLGLAFCVSVGIATWQRVAAFAISFIGIATLYLTHVRSSLIVLVVSLIIYIIVLLLQKERVRAMLLTMVASSVVVGALVFSAVIGGQAVFDRVGTLLDDDPFATYRQSRGYMVEQAFRVLLYNYPAGSGLGRWGMMRVYFGDETNAESPSIWAEVQWASWILDGGIILLVLYSVALVIATAQQWKIAILDRSPAVRSMAALVLATNLGTLALLFSYTPFCAPVGAQYWFLAGALAGISRLGVESGVFDGRGFEVIQRNARTNLDTRSQVAT